MATTHEAEASSPSVFISYRRGASSDITGRIHDWLERELGQGRVLRDVDSIPIGVKFWEHLEKQLSTCDVLLAVIGPGWLEELGRQEDFVAMELAFALRRDIPIVPVLVGGIEMPGKEQLPEPLRGVAAFQAMTIDSGHEFRRKVIDLATALRSLHARAVADRTAQAPALERRWFASGRLAIAAAVVVAIVAVVLGLTGQRTERDATLAPKKGHLETTRKTPCNCPPGDPLCTCL